MDEVTDDSVHMAKENLGQVRWNGGAAARFAKNFEDGAATSSIGQSRCSRS